MREVSLERAKEIITEPCPVETDGRSRNMLNFTRMCMEAELYTLHEVDLISRASHDLVHFSGVHKFRYSPMKADELRWYWSLWWTNDNLINKVDGLRGYIIDLCESRVGKSTRTFGLFLNGADSRRPWRTPEWYAARQKSKAPFEPLSEFYPYISNRAGEEHELLLAVEALVPKSLPKWSRADICQDLLVAVLTGEATLENVRDNVPRYIKWFFSKEPSKYGDLSLDMPMRSDSFKGGNNVRTLGDAIAAEYR